MIGAIGRGRALRADLQQDGRVRRTAIDQQAGKLDAVDITHRNGGCTGLWDQRGIAETEDNCLRVCDCNGRRELIDTGRQDQVLARSKCSVDLLGSVGVGSDEEAGDRQRVADTQAAFDPGCGV